MSVGSSSAGSPTDTSGGGWTAPSEVEQALFEARGRDDWGGYLGVLARQRVYFEVRRERVDAEPSGTSPVFGHDPRTGGLIWAVYTEGMLPPPEPHRVFDWNRLGWFAKVWAAGDPPYVVVNPGSPCEAFLPSAPPHSAAWARYSEEAGFPEYRSGLRTLRVGGPLEGPVAHGLACGALLFVRSGLPWNAMAYHGRGYPTERKTLKDWWGVGSAAEWQVQQRALLALDGANPVWEFALQVRRTIARDFGGHVETGYWRDAAARVLRRRAEGETVITADGVTTTPTVPEAETEARVKGVQHLIGRITRYEARFRADGLLAENRFVGSVDAWDIGRASGMARWGLGARYCDLRQAEAAVVEAGLAAARSYRSWQDFSAGYILGRCLHFDDEEFGDWYTSALETHRILMSEKESPWRTLPFR
ncbi:DUF1266 domain-containing protein [Streptomyces mangrovisoli]|uniref:DUF1266 domain-containing protein n=1 Tax=Streptomyces mangrovisoli TaxID=1428628 RepID=A0A1J4NS02_9ACTN|nr:DUF1266 domain-containing protein [Streptomyces mangrovisoli]OIJ65167.1 hypothetical protein WN71_025510 [Streptomyces mangrovisoli]